jgi:putative selenate reductase
MRDMAELIPAPFENLVARLYAEPAAQDSLFGLPRKKWHVPKAGDPDLSVSFHGQRAGNPSGPAAGPQTQMAQNLLLSYAAGARVMELKTVQVNDRLVIGRPCIDANNVGYNIEFSQELLVEQSLREYVAGSMLIEMFRHAHNLHGDGANVIYDMSVGYDLAGIRGEKVQRFIDGMRDASKTVDALRSQIPPRFSAARDLNYPTALSRSVTLSTFHGCPANEIERICQFLIVEKDLDVIVKMNPPMLGPERLEHLLYDVLGYIELKVPPHAYTSGLQFGEAVQLVDRLSRVAQSRGRHFGCKFSNTLEVVNHRQFFPPGNDVQYLSGQPLHVITIVLADVFRQAVGPRVHFSFSAGIDRQNFPLVVACGFVPVTVCTDLLRPGGFGRLSGYLQSLAQAMKAVGAANISDYILAFSGEKPVEAAARNTAIVAEKARNDPRYRSAQNRKVPIRVDSHLTTFDCLTCDKCIPVCPNAANFTYPTLKAAFDCQDILIDPSGRIDRVPGRRFEITYETQIANYADFCNECGNCDTFCPEYDGPYIKKPAFYSSMESFHHAVPRDGFVVTELNFHWAMVGRIKGSEYSIAHDPTQGKYVFRDAAVELTLAAADHALISARPLQPLTSPHRVDMWIFHAFRHLLHGVLDPRQINQINAPTSVNRSL